MKNLLNQIRVPAKGDVWELTLSTEVIQYYIHDCIDGMIHYQWLEPGNKLTRFGRADPVYIDFFLKSFEYVKNISHEELT